MLTKIKVISKINYFSKELQIHRGDAKKTWKIIQKLLPPSRKSSRPYGLHDDLVVKTEEFNQFFYSIGKKLANEVTEHRKKV